MTFWIILDYRITSYNVCYTKLLREIKEKFGDTIYEIVNGVTKINEIYYDTFEEKQSENYRKLIIRITSYNVCYTKLLRN